MKVPPHIQQWLDQRALTLVPVAAAEFLDDKVDLAERLAVCQGELRQLAARESETPMGDLLRLREHESTYLRAIYEATEALAGEVRQCCNEDRYRTWRQAVSRYERRTA